MNSPRCRRAACAVGLSVLSLLAAVPAARAQAPKIDGPWVPSTAYVVPKETAPEGEGYFAIVEGHNQRLYVGTHANGVNSWLVEFDPAARAMKTVVDAHRAITVDCKGFA